MRVRFCWIFICKIIRVCFLPAMPQLAEKNVYNIAQQIELARFLVDKAPLEFLTRSSVRAKDKKSDGISFQRRTVSRSDGNRGQLPTPYHPRPRPRVHLHSHPHVTSSSSILVGHTSPSGQGCENFAFAPTPPPNRKRIGPRCK